jgi:hypothetical protein
MAFALEASTQGLTQPEVAFCEGKVAKAKAQDKTTVQTNCLVTRQYLRHVMTCRPGDYTCAGKVPSEVSMVYGMNLFEQALIMDLRLGNFFNNLM